MMNNTNWFQRRNIAIKRTCTLNICVENTIKNSACAASSVSPSSAKNVSLKKTAPVRFRIVIAYNFTLKYISVLLWLISCVVVHRSLNFLYQQVVHLLNAPVKPMELQNRWRLKPPHSGADLKLLNCEWARAGFQLVNFPLWRSTTTALKNQKLA